MLSKAFSKSLLVPTNTTLRGTRTSKECTPFLSPANSPVFVTSITDSVGTKTVVVLVTSTETTSVEEARVLHAPRPQTMTMVLVTLAETTTVEEARVHHTPRPQTIIVVLVTMVDTIPVETAGELHAPPHNLVAIHARTTISMTTVRATSTYFPHPR